MRKLLILALATVFLLSMCVPAFGYRRRPQIEVEDSNMVAVGGSEVVVVELINENFAVSGNASALGNEAFVCIRSSSNARACVETDADGEVENEGDNDTGCGVANGFRNTVDQSTAAWSSGNDATSDVCVVAVSCVSVENTGSAYAVSGDATATQNNPSNRIRPWML